MSEKEDVSDAFTAIVRTSYCLHARELLSNKAKAVFTALPVSVKWMARNLPEDFALHDMSARAEIMGFSIEAHMEMVFIFAGALDTPEFGDH